MNKSIHVKCLHGYGQDASIMYKKMGHLFDQNILMNNDNLNGCKPISFKEIIIDCLDGPYNCAPFGTISSRGWWFQENPGMYNQPHQYHNVDAALKLLEKNILLEKNYIRDYYHVDILCGFSQGAICAMIAVDKKVVLPQLLILISPVEIMDDEWKIKDKIDIPTLVIFGKRDLFYSDDTTWLNNYFTNYHIITHQGGHIIPDSKVIGIQVMEWIYEMTK